MSSPRVTMDGVTYTKRGLVTSMLGLSIVYAGLTYDRCKKPILDGMPLATYFAAFATISVVAYSVHAFCEVFNRHTTLHAVDVYLSM